MRDAQQDNPAFLGDILKCIDHINTYTQGGEAEFMTSNLIQDAVIRNFEIIGEATKRLSPELRQTYPNIPWRRMAGFRDILIHSYMTIDTSTIWQAIVEILSLEAELQTIYQAIESSPN
jgi:uncharacterized protein with HEPN domain